MPKVELTIKNGVQKGPATDYSMLLEMKRRTLSQVGQIVKNPVGDQGKKPFIREGHLQAGSGTEGTGAVEFYKLRGLNLNRYKF
jgi:hypothetical protein